MTRSFKSLVVLVASTALSASLLGVFAWSWGLERLDVRILVITGLFASLDFGDLLFRLYLRHSHTRGQPGTRPSPTSVRLDVGEFTPVQVRHHLKPYGVVASLYNAEAELDDFIEAIEPFRDRVWVIDDASTDETVARLQEAGIRCLPSPVNQKKPKALRDLVASLDPAIATVVVLDPDSRILHRGAGNDTDLERVVFEFQRSGAAGLCPCLSVHGHGLLGRLQQLEYWLSFNFGRYSLNDHSVTSGIAIYRRDALEGILATASSVYAEDLNNTLSLFARGERVYYDGRLIVETTGPDTWSRWFSQRVGWYFGLLKVYIESWPELRRWARCEFFVWYQFVLYTGVVSILLQPLRVIGLGLLLLSVLAGVAELVGVNLGGSSRVFEPAYFVLTYLQGTVLVLFALVTARSSARRALWIRMLPAVPFYLLYALVQTVPITVGYLNWFTLRLFGRRVYRDHFQDDASLRAELYGAAR